MREDGQRTCFLLGKTPGLGRILLFDDIEELLKWSKWGFRLRPTVEKSQEYVYRGDYALKFFTSSVIPDGTRISFCYRDFYLVPHDRLRFELCWLQGDASQTWPLEFYVVKHWNGIQHRFGFRLSAAGFGWSYLGADNDWHFIDGGAQYPKTRAWHRLAFEVDVGSGEYVKLESDALCIELSGVEYRKFSTGLPAAYQGIRLGATIAGGGMNLFYDDVLVRCV